MKKKNLANSIKETAIVILSPYLTFLFIMIFLVGGLFMGVEELWEEFTSKTGIKEITTNINGYLWPLPRI